MRNAILGGIVVMIVLGAGALFLLSGRGADEPTVALAAPLFIDETLLQVSSISTRVTPVLRGVGALPRSTVQAMGTRICSLLVARVGRRCIGTKAPRWRVGIHQGRSTRAGT